MKDRLTAIHSRLETITRAGEEESKRFYAPVSEAAAVVFKTASNWGQSIDPGVAQAIAENLAKYYKVEIPESDLKSVVQHEIRLENL